jgi:hypothetical protein
VEEDNLALRLAQMQDALLALPDDAFAEKYELLEEEIGCAMKRPAMPTS